jgi:hypothetical protein
MRNAFSLLVFGLIGRPSSESAVGWNCTNLTMQSRHFFSYDMNTSHIISRRKTELGTIEGVEICKVPTATNKQNPSV